MNAAMFQVYSHATTLLYSRIYWRMVQSTPIRLSILRMHSVVVIIAGEQQGQKSSKIAGIDHFSPDLILISSHRSVSSLIPSHPIQSHRSVSSLNSSYPIPSHLIAPSPLSQLILSLPSLIPSHLIAPYPLSSLLISLLRILYLHISPYPISIPIFVS